MDGRGVLGYGGKKMLKNLWQKRGYDWFEGVVEEDEVVEDKDDNNDSNKAYDNGDEDNNKEDKEVFSGGDDDKEEWEDREVHWASWPTSTIHVRLSERAKSRLQVL
jgi:hypothetical protein